MKFTWNSDNAYEVDRPIQVSLTINRRELNYVRLYEMGDMKASDEEVIKWFVESMLDLDLTMTTGRY